MKEICAGMYEMAVRERDHSDRVVQEELKRMERDAKTEYGRKVTAAARRVMAKAEEGKKSEIRGQRSEVGGQRSEGGGQRSDGEVGWWLKSTRVSTLVDHSRSPWKVNVFYEIQLGLCLDGMRGELKLGGLIRTLGDAERRLTEIVGGAGRER